MGLEHHPAKLVEPLRGRLLAKKGTLVLLDEDGVQEDSVFAQREGWQPSSDIHLAVGPAEGWPEDANLNSFSVFAVRDDLPARIGRRDAGRATLSCNRTAWLGVSQSMIAGRCGGFDDDTMFLDESSGKALVLLVLAVVSVSLIAAASISLPEISGRFGWVLISLTACWHSVRRRLAPCRRTLLLVVALGLGAWCTRRCPSWFVPGGTCSSPDVRVRGPHGRWWLVVLTGRS